MRSTKIIFIPVLYRGCCDRCLISTRIGNVMHISHDGFKLFCLVFLDLLTILHMAQQFSDGRMQRKSKRNRRYSYFWTVVHREKTQMSVFGEAVFRIRSFPERERGQITSFRDRSGGFSIERVEDSMSAVSMHRSQQCSCDEKQKKKSGGNQYFP